MPEAGVTLRLGRHAVDVSSADKRLFPDDGITKEDLVRYAAAIAATMLPHLRARPLTLQRFPTGINAKGFVQQQRPDHFPSLVGRIDAHRLGDGSVMQHVACGNAACLAYLANQNVITLHRWLSRAPKLDHPDLLIFDLDPPDGQFAAVRRAAAKVRTAFEAAKLVPYVMTTGGKGAHVVAPLSGTQDFDTVRRFAQALADALAAAYPDELTTEQRKAKRGGRVFLDILRNAYGQTAVAPYAVRARAGAPVATPIEWSELARVEPADYHLRNVLRRLARKPDPWADIRRHARPVPRA